MSDTIPNGNQKSKKNRQCNDQEGNNTQTIVNRTLHIN